MGVKVSRVNFESGEIKAAVFTKSEMMSIFNYARAAARRGDLDGERVNRAFGLIQSGRWVAKFVEYGTTAKNCNCPDHLYRRNVCKHIICAMFIARIVNIRWEKERAAEKLAASLAKEEQILKELGF